MTSGLRPPLLFALQEWPCPHGSNADYDFQPQNTRGHFSCSCFLKEHVRGACGARRASGRAQERREAGGDSYEVQGKICALTRTPEAAAGRPCWTSLSACGYHMTYKSETWNQLKGLKGETEFSGFLSNHLMEKRTDIEKQVSKKLNNRSIVMI